MDNQTLTQKAGAEPSRTVNRCNPCGVCSRNSLECPWILEHRPVPGWNAVPTRIEDHKIPENQDSWRIFHCPLYVPPLPRKSRTHFRV